MPVNDTPISPEKFEGENVWECGCQCDEGPGVGSELESGGKWDDVEAVEVTELGI